jgi:hypothetical protein
LVLSANPSLTGSQVRQILEQSADDLGPAGWDSSYGWGRVNVARAVSMAAGVTADVTAPSVSFGSPSDGSIVSGTVLISVSAADNAAVTSVSLSVDGGPAATDTVAPYVFNWITNAVANGTHSLTATAVDSSGNKAAVSVSVLVNNVQDVTAPLISITSPKNNSKVTSNVSVMVSTSDNIGVTKVELYVDGSLQAASTTAPFTTKWNTTKATKGVHTFSCKAYDAAGNAGVSQLVSVTK